MRSSVGECSPDQKITEICENVPFLEKSLHSVVILEQVFMQNTHRVQPGLLITQLSLTGTFSVFFK